jgi:cyclic pyranopterin phosphate synthase
MSDLPHLTTTGEVHMVDVSSKPNTEREAVAEAKVTLSESTKELLFGGGLKKGDALASIRLAGIMAAKKTSDLIPLCHPVAITGVTVEVTETSDGALIKASAKTTGPTGIEMEAMTAVSVAALALYDMVKGVERGVSIGPIELVTKTGGRSGTWER